MTAATPTRGNRGTVTAATARGIPGVRAATAADIGPRRWQADAAASWRDPATGNRAYALCDGIGDEAGAAAMAACAARTAARAATRRGAYGGILAARAEARAFYDGAPPGQADNAVIVVAAPMDARHGGGITVAWAGDARAYALDPGGQLEQLTADHTEGAAYRRPDRPAWMQAIAPSRDHVVTSSVLYGEIGDVRVLGPLAALLLCSDGLHRRLDTTAIAAALTGATPRTAARRLLAAARAAGLRDNTTATVVGPTTLTP